MSSEKLKTCPFCRGNPTIYHICNENDNNYELWSVRCENVWCDIQPKTKEYGCKELAIKVWNDQK